jgi:hypothetical protein
MLGFSPLGASPLGAIPAAAPKTLQGLTFLFGMLLGDGAPPVVGTQAWIKVAGTWRQATVWINVGGVWKTTTAYVKVGTWR